MRSLTPEQRLDRLAELFLQNEKTGWEIAEHCWHLVKVDGLGQTEVAKAVGRTQGTIAKYIKTWDSFGDYSSRNNADWTFGDYYNASQEPASVLVAEEHGIRPTRAQLDHQDTIRAVKQAQKQGLDDSQVREIARGAAAEAAAARSSMTDTEKAVDSRQRAEVHEATSGVRRQVANVHTVGLVSDFQALAKAVSVAVENDADIDLSDFQQIRKAYNSIGEDLVVYAARRSLDSDLNIEVLR